jgi:hypothetical protein
MTNMQFKELMQYIKHDKMSLEALADSIAYTDDTLMSMQKLLIETHKMTEVLYEHHIKQIEEEF